METEIEKGYIVLESVCHSKLHITFEKIRDKNHDINNLENV